MKPLSTFPLKDRVHTVANSLAQDLSFAPEQPYLFDLHDLAALDIQGNSAATFLQGQVTCDVTAITSTQMRPGGICTLQGRLLALLDVIEWEGWHLILPKDLLAVTQQSLAKAALFSRVRLEPNPLIYGLGLYGPAAKIQELISIPLPSGAWHCTQSTDYYCYQLSETLWILLLRDPKQKVRMLAQCPAQQQLGSLAWHYLELSQYRMSIYPSTRGQFLPHRLNLQTTSYLSFNKGCYKGQEIIARTQYRAKLKHNLKLFQISSPDPIFAGQKCYADLGKTEIGEIVDYCPLGPEDHLLAISILIEHPEQVCLESHTRMVGLKAFCSP